MALALAVVTGYVDAVGFARLLGVFPANQTGNLVFLGIAIGGRGESPGWRTATAIVAFAAGAALGYLVGERLNPRRRGPTLLGAELALLLVVLVIAGRLESGGHLPVGLEAWALIALSGVAMGVQTEVIRHVAGIAVTTTYETGALTRMGEIVSGPFSRDRDARRATGLAVLGSVIVAYVAGAAIGASAIGRWNWALVPPCLVLVALIIGWVALPEWFAAVEDPVDPDGGPNR